MFHALFLSSWVKLILKDSDFLTTKNSKKWISDQTNPYLWQHLSNEFVFIQLYIGLHVKNKREQMLKQLNMNQKEHHKNTWESI